MTNPKEQQVDLAKLREMFNALTHRCQVYDQLLVSIIDSVSTIGNGVSFRQQTEKKKFEKLAHELQSVRTELSQHSVSADKPQR